MPTFSQAQADRRLLLFKICASKEELHDWVYAFLGVDLPDVIVDPRTNCTPLQMVWDVYAHFTQVHTEEQPSSRLFYANRFGGKTLGMAIAEVLILLHVGNKIIHLAALLEQSEDAQGYLKDFFNLPDLAGFMIGDNIRETVAIHYRPPGGGLCLTRNEWRELPPEQGRAYKRIVGRAVVVAASVKAANGKHGLLLVLDEHDLISNPKILAQAVNIPTPLRRLDGTHIMPLTVMVSTRKVAHGPVQDAIDKKEETGLVVKYWNILATTERCPTSRHLPELPRIPIYRSDESLRAVDPATFDGMTPKDKETFVKDEGYTGCLTKCKMFAACRGLLATGPGDSEFLKPVADTANKFKENTIDGARSELLCLKPSSAGLIYGHLMDLPRHVISPAQAFHMVFGAPPPGGDPTLYSKADLMNALAQHDGRYGAGQDYGFTHFFATVLGYKWGSLGLVLRNIAYPELNPVRQIEVCEPIKPFAPRVYGDTAYPGQIELFSRAGYKMMDWNKGKGSVHTGITIVQKKLAPMNGTPELYFVHDVGLDPEMGLLIKHMQEYHWTVDAAGRPTDEPDQKNDDIPDATRYWVMNEFPMTGRDVVFAAGKSPDEAAAAVYAEKFGGKPPVGSAPSPIMAEILAKHLAGPGPGSITGGSGKKGSLRWST